MNTVTMMSRWDALFASTIFGSHAGKSEAADITAAEPRNCRRESSLYSWQPQSASWSSSVIAASSVRAVPSVPLESVRADREGDRLAHARVVERAAGHVRVQRRLRR